MILRLSIKYQKRIACILFAVFYLNLVLPIVLHAEPVLRYLPINTNRAIRGPENFESSYARAAFSSVRHPSNLLGNLDKLQNVTG